MDRAPDADRAPPEAGTPGDGGGNGGSGDGTGSTNGPGSGDEGGERAGARRGDGRGRDVVVPDRVYKTVAVFSTLIAVVAVVIGFMLLDAASLQAGIARSVVGAAMDLFGVTARTSTLNAALAIAGLAAIAGGAWVYTVGSRFRAPGMEKPQEGSDETSDDG